MGPPTRAFWTYGSSYNGDGQAAATLQHVHGLGGQGDSWLKPDRPEQFEASREHRWSQTPWPVEGHEM